VPALRRVQPAGRVVLPAMQGAEAEMTDRERELWLMLRQALLLMVDAIERFLELAPRTSELRKERKGQG